MAKPMTSNQPPSGYQDGGEPIALAVVEGIRPWSWATEMATLLGYRQADLQAWVDHYRKEHAEEIEQWRRHRERKERARQRRLRRARKQRGLPVDG